MGKVYVITMGCYSDYHICAVTLDREKAEHLRKLYLCEYGGGYDPANIEEYELDIPVDESVSELIGKEPIKYYTVKLAYDVLNNEMVEVNVNRDIEELYCINRDDVSKEAEFYFSPFPVGTYRYFFKPRQFMHYDINVFTDTAEKAKKIALDKFYMFLAEKNHLV